MDTKEEITGEQEEDKPWQFQPGNRFWEASPTHGRKTEYTPEELSAACTEYFVWVDENPLLEDNTHAYQGKVQHESVAKMRAMTIEGLCCYLGIVSKTWRNYRDRVEFLPITTRVDEIIRTQKFEGAAAGLLEGNIIARDLGLAEKKEITERAIISEKPFNAEEWEAEYGDKE